MTRMDTETRIRVRRESGEPMVEYVMLPDVAEELAEILDREARRTGDTGWRDDSNRLLNAAEEAAA